jgi:hypothetical protein
MNRILKFAGASAVAAALSIGAVATAAASPAPPAANKALYGTWVNVDSHTRSVKQIVIGAARSGSVAVDAFGSCTPTLCQWGSVPAITYGTSVSASTGATFQSNQAFLTGKKEWSRTTLTGTVRRTKAGNRLYVRELTVFEDGSGRKNYNVQEVFKLGKGLRATKIGHTVSTYRHGNPPALNAGALGTWVHASPAGNIAKLTIGGSLTTPIVHGYGKCSPTACNWGAVKAIGYGKTISSAKAQTILAPFTFGFKKTQLVITYSVVNEVERLTVTMYNEFTDTSHRSNYVVTETLVRP